MNEVYEFLKKCGTYYLATIDAQGKPSIRPFGTVDIFDGQLTIQTGKIKEVSKQIHNNPNVSICAFDGKEWLRLNATAIEEERIEAAEHMLDEYPSLQGMYKAGDGNTEIFKLTNVKATISSFVAAPKTYEW
ncbi:MAG: pyridoxamine 5'-phosphate oxidase family protein [Erysipelotrichaceae bacterium]|nr:pyridoxamine 5'-phosphate oxidase family protein [Erysipelotrichaceae bacterium]